MFQSRVAPRAVRGGRGGALEMTDEQFRARCARPSPTSRACSRPRARCGTASRRRSSTTPGDPADAASTYGPHQHLKQRRAGARARAATGSSTSRRRPRCIAHIVTRLGEAGLNRPPSTPAAGCASSSRSRSGATWPPRGALNQRGRRRLQRGPGLPHRSLPRQGDGPEHPGVPLRQRHLRAAVEPQARRPRADHGGRGDRASRAAAATTRRSGALRDMIQNHILQLLCLVAMEPPVTFDADAGARREDQGACARSARSRPTRWTASRCAGSTGRASCGGQRCRATARRRASRPSRITETFAALRARDRQLALGGRAVLPAHRQAPAQARERDRDPVQADARTWSSGATRRSAPSPTCSCSASSPTRACRSRSAPSCRARSCASSRSTMEFDYGAGLRRRAARGLRAPAAGRDEGRRHALRARRLGRRWRGSCCSRCSTPGPPAIRGKFPNYEAGTWGPAEADTLIERSGRRWRRP